MVFYYPYHPYSEDLKNDTATVCLYSSCCVINHTNTTFNHKPASISSDSNRLPLFFSGDLLLSLVFSGKDTLTGARLVYSRRQIHRKSKIITQIGELPLSLYLPGFGEMIFDLSGSRIESRRNRTHLIQQLFSYRRSLWRE